MDGLERFSGCARRAQHPRVATPDTETITQELVTATIREVFPEVPTTKVDTWCPAHADLSLAFNLADAVAC